MLRGFFIAGVVMACCGCAALFDPSLKGFCDRDSYNAHSSYRKMCENWRSSKKAFYQKRWDDAIRLATAARTRNQYDEMDEMIAAAQRAKAENDTSPYNMRLNGWCPKELGARKDNDVFQSLRCPQAKMYIGSQSSTAGGINGLRADLRARMNSHDPHALTRAVYVHACRLHIQITKRDYPLRNLGCLWHTQQLEWERIKAEIAPLPAAEQTLVMNSLKSDVAWLTARADAKFPGARDREVLVQLPTTVLANHRRFQQENAAALQAIAAFHAGIMKGDVANCARGLGAVLASHMAGSGSKPARVRARLGEGVGPQIADALAHCHYLNDRTSMAIALRKMLKGLGGPTTFAEKRYAAVRKVLFAERAKARKMPHLRGKSLASASPDDLKRPRFHVPAPIKRWNGRKYNLARYGYKAEGVVSKIQKTGNGVRLHFKKTRVPRTDEKCVETRRIERITSDGEIVYRLKCRVTRRYTENVGPKPVDVFEAGAVKRGRFVTAIRGKDQGLGAVMLVARSAKEGARLYRMADVLIP